MTMLMILLFDIIAFGWGLLASVLGSLLVVIILFVFFRPRIKVRKEIALDENGKMMFCFKNVSLSSCFNINVAIAVVDVDNNADEDEATITLERNYGAYMAGRLGKENDSEICVKAIDTITPIPSHLRIIISAQHAISGLTSVTTRDFVASNAKKGKFEKGIFVPNESTYGKVYTRAQMKIIKIIGWILGVIMAVAVSLFGCFLMKSWIELLVLIGLLAILWFTVILLLYVRVQSRVNAYSSEPHKIFNLLNITVNRRENPMRNRDIQDVVPND